MKKKMFSTATWVPYKGGAFLQGSLLGGTTDLELITMKSEGGHGAWR